jgi:hypothetical protein
MITSLAETHNHNPVVAYLVVVPSNVPLDDLVTTTGQIQPSRQRELYGKTSPEGHAEAGERGDWG